MDERTVGERELQFRSVLSGENLRGNVVAELLTVLVDGIPDNLFSLCVSRKHVSVSAYGSDSLLDHDVEERLVLPASPMPTNDRPLSSFAHEIGERFLIFAVFEVVRDFDFHLFLDFESDFSGGVLIDFLLLDISSVLALRLQIENRAGFLSVGDILVQCGFREVYGGFRYGLYGFRVFLVRFQPIVMHRPIHSYELGGGCNDSKSAFQSL